jgi:hypothetical protein
MAEDLTLSKDATFGKDAEPPNAMEGSKDLTLPDGRQAPFRVECNVYEDISLSVPAPDACFTVWQRIRRRGEEQLVDSVQVLCREEADGSINVRVLVWTPETPALQIAHLTTRPTDANDGLIECDLSHKTYEIA